MKSKTLKYMWMMSSSPSLHMHPLTLNSSFPWIFGMRRGRREIVKYYSIKSILPGYKDLCARRDNFVISIDITILFFACYLLQYGIKKLVCSPICPIFHEPAFEEW